jgi:hypothetical protein
MHRRTRAGAAAAALLAALALAACGGGDEAEQAVDDASELVDQAASVAGEAVDQAESVADQAAEVVESVTASDWASAADAICADTQQQLDALGEPSAPDEAAELIQKGAEIAAAQLEALRDLTPPADIAARVDEAYGYLEQELDLFDDLAAAVESGDEAASNAVVATLDELDAKADAIAGELGLSECGSS